MEAGGEDSVGCGGGGGPPAVILSRDPFEGTKVTGIGVVVAAGGGYSHVTAITSLVTVVGLVKVVPVASSC